MQAKPERRSFGVRFSPDGMEVALAVARRPDTNGPIFIRPHVRTSVQWHRLARRRMPPDCQIVIDIKAGIGVPEHSGKQA